MRDTVCIYSGGMDSLTLVQKAYADGILHSCLSFNYGQRHVKELACARTVCKLLGVSHQVIDLRELAPVLASTLTFEGDIPEGHYADENMKLTVVPNRNMIMLSIAIAYAVTHKLRAVQFGAHSGDHTIYPDCRPEFVGLMDLAGRTANWHPVAIEAPFIDTDKAGILRVGYRLGVDYSLSWTCYKGEDLACGKCGSCQERLEAFKLIGARDPLIYESADLVEERDV